MPPDMRSSIYLFSEAMREERDPTITFIRYAAGTESSTFSGMEPGRFQKSLETKWMWYVSICIHREEIQGEKHDSRDIYYATAGSVKSTKEF